MAGNAEHFTYWRPKNQKECLEPLSPGNYTKQESNDISGAKCGSSNFNSTDRIFFCYFGPFESSEQIELERLRIQGQIDEINRSTLSQIIKEVLIDYYEWCLECLAFKLGNQLVEEGKPPKQWICLRKCRISSPR